MSCETRTEVLLIDDSDHASITLTRRDSDSEPPWMLTASGGGTTVYVSSADLAEFVYAVRDLIADDLPGPDPFMREDD